MCGQLGNRLSYDPYLLIMSGMTKHTRLPLVTALAVCALLCMPDMGDQKSQTSGQRASSGRATGKKASAIPPRGQRKRRQSVTRIPLVGNIAKASLIGCGCFWQLPAEQRAGSPRYFFISDHLKRAWLNIAGNALELRLTGAPYMSLKTQKGRRAHFHFRAAGISGTNALHEDFHLRG